MNQFLTFICLCYFFGCKNSEKKVEPLPNIVFIFADDLTYSAIHALGNKDIITPNLDLLVNQGTSFTHAYNMGAWSGAVCAASRAMIISGRSVWDANQFRQNWISGNDTNKSWPKLMETNGYITYMTGKWHIDIKATSLFKNTKHIRPGMPNDAWSHQLMVEKFKTIEGTTINPATIMPIGYNRPFHETDTTWLSTNKNLSGYWEGGKHWSEVLKDDAISFINNVKQTKHPFFMYLAFNAPHDPRQAPQEYLNKYPVENINLPKNWLPQYPFKDAIGCGQNVRDEALAPFPRTEFATKKHIQEYYALITHLDTQVGEIIKALEASEKMNNTYIIFTSDHGLAMGEHGLLGKQNLFEHSIRAPFIITGPNVPEGKQIDSDIYIQDAMATSLDLAGIKKPNYVAFNSIMDLINGNRTISHYNSIYGAYMNLQRMIRKDDFKLIVYPKIDKILLFDLKNDPEEMKNLSDNPDYKSKVKIMLKELIVLQKEMNDPLYINSIP